MKSRSPCTIPLRNHKAQSTVVREEYENSKFESPAKKSPTEKRISGGRKSLTTPPTNLLIP